MGPLTSVNQIRVWKEPIHEDWYQVNKFFLLLKHYHHIFNYDTNSYKLAICSYVEEN